MSKDANEVHTIPLVLGGTAPVPGSPREKNRRDGDDEDKGDGKRRKKGSPRKRIDGRTMGTKVSGNTPPVLGKRAVLGHMMNEML